MGDLIQTLPALTEAGRNISDIQFDWVAEEAFKDIPSWHSKVDKVISMANRRWKKNPFKSLRKGEIKDFYRQLRGEKYDIIIDAQSNLKSALVTYLAKGIRFGVSSEDVREFGAHFAYDKTISVPRIENHCLRMRRIFSQVLDYSMDESMIDYGIDLTLLPKINFEIPTPFIFITHTVSRDNKLWPFENWEKLIRKIGEHGFFVALPWWTDIEKTRAEKLSEISEKVIVLPKFNLSEKAPIIKTASAMVSCDTGLAHLAAALNIPNVVLYGPKDPKLHATVGKHQIHLFANYPPCAPCDRSRCYAKEKATMYSPCLEKISADSVLEELLVLLKK